MCILRAARPAVYGFTMRRSKTQKLFPILCSANKSIYPKSTVGTAVPVQLYLLVLASTRSSRYVLSTGTRSSTVGRAGGGASICRSDHISPGPPYFEASSWLQLNTSTS